MAETTFEQISVPDQLSTAESFIAENRGLIVARYLEGDRVQFREIGTGRFSYAANVWQEFRDLIKEVGHS